MNQAPPNHATPEFDPAFARTDIVLVGLMGAGKTSIGKRLAARLGRPFVDTDNEIEAEEGMSVSEIFAARGEAHFRAVERRAVAGLLDGSGRVLATGGGAFMDPGTRSLIARRAVSVWLKAGLDVLARRVARRNTRPLLAGGDPRAVLQALIEVRYPVYAGADVTVESADAPREEMVDKAVRALQAYRAAGADR